MKTKVYNLIIIDESGSMGHLQKQTISGCNETLNTIRSAQKAYSETQDQLVSIYFFQSHPQVPSRYIIKNAPIEEVSDIDNKTYQPSGCTPLYDAVGSTLADLKAVTAGEELAIANVTIITDGMENASEVYTLRKVAKMIAELKEKGWNFSFIGANIDVEGTAKMLNIENSLEFQHDEDGTKLMFEKENERRMRYARKNDEMMKEHLACEAPIDEIYRKFRENAKGYFTRED